MWQPVSIPARRTLLIFFGLWPQQIRLFPADPRVTVWRIYRWGFCLIVGSLKLDRVGLSFSHTVLFGEGGVE